VKRVTAGLVAMVLLAGACGGDGDGNGVDGPAAKAEFIEQATLICKEAAADVEEAGVPLFGPGAQSTRDELTRFLRDVVLPAVREQVVDLRQLEPPTSEREEFDAFLAEADRTIDGLEARLEEDPESFFREGANPFEAANEKAAAMGLDACAGEP
jgi:hypothetical protein